MGTVLERPDGRIVVQWVDGSGRKRQRTVKRRAADGTALSTSARRKEARRLAAELDDLAERQRVGLAPRPLRSNAATFGELHACWEAAGARRSRAFLAFVRPHVESLFRLPAADVTTAAVDRHLTAKAERLAPKSVKLIRDHLHAVFEAARVQGGPWEGRPNPVAAARPIKVPEKPVQIIRPEEWPTLEAEVPAKWRGPVAASFFTGLRRGDVFALRKRDVDLARGTITTTNGKTGKVVTLPIATGLRPHLEAALAATPGAYLFEVDRTKRLPNLVKMLRRACGRAGLVTGYELRCRSRKGCGWSEERGRAEVPDACPRCGKDMLYARPIPRHVRFHDLRHSFGTAVVAAGGTGAGQALLAHSDPRMTQRYTHLADTHLSEVVAKAFRAAPVLRNGGSPAGQGLPAPLPQQFPRVGPPGIEPGLRASGSGF